MAERTRLIAGAMSGTSADGVDVAIVRIVGSGLEMKAGLVHHHHRAYDTSLRAAIFDIRAGRAVALSDLARIGREISLTYATAVNEALTGASLNAGQLEAIAAHGQTLFHDPPNTIQWFDPALVAAEVGCAVVSDFRRADCAAGGQGAPLVPFADYILFRDSRKSRALLNIGGIANVTYLRANRGPDEIIAFDTGPGNCISDHLMRELHPEGDGVDHDGVLASLGAADQTIARNVLSAPYFQLPPPKSTDGPAMIDLYHAQVLDLGGRSQLPHHLATACLITAKSIVRALHDWTPQFPDEVIASGGGTKNQTLMKFLQSELHGVPLRTIDDLGVKSDAKEAIAFALLAAATLDGVPSNVPSATGARRAVVLGSITPKPTSLRIV
jgi:anhydro-N-acetylmuramic acid kinase